jgi:hypothetical protein
MPPRGGAPDAEEAALGESGPESSAYEFPGGYPSPETVQRAYDDADLNRAVQAYRFFFASVSGLAIFKGNEVLGAGEFGVRNAGHRAQARGAHLEFRYSLRAAAA